MDTNTANRRISVRRWISRLSVVVAGTLFGSAFSAASADTVSPSGDTYTLCESGHICTFTRADGSETQVIGPYLYDLTLDEITLLIGPPEGLKMFDYPPFQGAPGDIVQNAPPTSVVALEQEAETAIAGLRGITDDTLNRYWSRGEITAYMYLRLLAIANAAAGTVSPQDAKVAQWYADRISRTELLVYTDAVQLFTLWGSNECTFAPPVGPPDAYSSLIDKATCKLDLAPVPSTQQFNAWAWGTLRDDDNTRFGQS